MIDVEIDAFCSICWCQATVDDSWLDGVSLSVLDENILSQCADEDLPIELHDFCELCTSWGGDIRRSYAFQAQMPHFVLVYCPIMPQHILIEITCVKYLHCSYNPYTNARDASCSLADVAFMMMQLVAIVFASVALGTLLFAFFLSADELSCCSSKIYGLYGGAAVAAFVVFQVTALILIISILITSEKGQSNGTTFQALPPEVYFPR